MIATTEMCKCTRCRNVHAYAERYNQARKCGVVSDSCCPKCGGKSWQKPVK